MEENKAEYDTKMLEYAQLLDLRAARIKVKKKKSNIIYYCLKSFKF